MQGASLPHGTILTKWLQEGHYKILSLQELQYGFTFASLALANRYKTIQDNYRKNEMI